MKFLDVWKNDVKSIINRTYGNGISQEKVDSILDHIIQNRKYDPVINLRNLYKFIPNFTIPANDILEVIEERDLNILANGLFTESVNTVMSPSSKILIDWGEKRDLFKGKELEAVEAGNDDLSRGFANKQLKVKQDSNSMYGASTMLLSYVSNIDIGASITAQARNFISEMMWSVEKCLSCNMVFKNINELYQYIDNTCKKEFSDDDMKYISYIPTVKDCTDKFLIISRDIEKFRKDTKGMTKSMYLLFKHMNDKERVAFYYTDNIYEFIYRNDTVRELFYSFIFRNDIDFMNPYEIPTELKDIIDSINYCCSVFVFKNTLTYDRVIKYETRKRKTVLISDTDSIMPCLSQFLDNILKMFGKEHLFDDPVISIKIVNLCVSIISYLCDKECIAFAKASNGNEKYMNRLKMKNEFYFQQLMMFTDAKKNYIAWTLIREGKIIPENKRLSIVGRAFGSSSINQDILAKMEKLIIENMLKTNNIDPYTIAKERTIIRNSIEEEILKGNIEYGIFKRFNGEDKIKNIETTADARSAVIWNRLYPEDELIGGDGMYTFNTSIISVEDVDKIDDKYSDIKEKIRDLIFNHYGNHTDKFIGQDFTRFGLTSIGIPAESDITTKIPEWIIPFIDVNKLIDKHMQPLMAISNGVGLSNGKTFQKKYTSSTLIKL